MYNAMQRFKIRDFSNSLAAQKFRNKPHPFFAVEKRYPAGYVSGLHLHDFPQLWYCKDGSYLHQTASGIHICKKGSLILIPPGNPDRFQMSANRSATLISVDLAHSFFQGICFEAFPHTFSNLLLSNYATQLGHTFPDHFTLDPEAQCIVEEALSRLSVYSGEAEVDIQAVIQALETVFSLPALALPEHLMKKAQLFARTRALPILNALIYINKNYSKKITVDELTKVSTLCHTDFFKYFKLYTGTSFSTYLQQLRVCHVTYLLGNTTYSFSHISDLCGYSDAAHMTNSFTRYTGRPPRIGRPKLQAYYSEKKNSPVQK